LPIALLRNTLKQNLHQMAAVREITLNRQNLDSLVHDAEHLYEGRLRAQLETSHPNYFVAIEPESGDYFLGRTLSDALGAARDAHPDRLSHAMRVGHKAALHFGISLR
jgi:hypothetical protein